MKLIRTNPGGLFVISEDRGTGVLRRIAEMAPEVDAGPMSDRLVTSFNAAEQVPMMRLVSLSNPSCKVKIHEMLAVLDLLIRTNPQLLDRLLKRVRGEG